MKRKLFSVAAEEFLLCSASMNEMFSSFETVNEEELRKSWPTFE